MADPAGPEAQDHLLIAPNGPALHDLAERLGRLAIARGITIGTAESCTGGLVGHLITAIAGSSAYYLGGVVSYADVTKTSLIGVPAETIERHGAVSAQVSVAMAEGVRERLGCDIAVAVTGVAGPDGGTPGQAGRTDLRGDRASRGPPGAPPPVEWRSRRQQATERGGSTGDAHR